MIKYLLKSSGATTDEYYEYETLEMAKADAFPRNKIYVVEVKQVLEVKAQITYEVVYGL